MDSDSITHISPKELGQRLQEARRASGRTQQEAATLLAVARTTLTAIEKGDRRVQPDELVRLAGIYGRGVNELLRERAEAESFAVQLRATAASRHVAADQVTPVTVEFQRLCEDYDELERLAGDPLRRRYPPVYAIEGTVAELAAEDVAVAERNRLGLGDGPLASLRELLEMDVGLRVFSIGMPAGVSEMFAYSEQLGGCIAVNRKHPRERRRMSTGHGYAHFLTSRYRAEICAGGYVRLPAHERFAGAFAGAFLMPAAGLSRRFHEASRRREAGVTMADILALAHLYVVSAEAMVGRLEDLRLLPPGTWERIKQKGVRVREAQSILGLAPHDAPDQMLPARYQYLAVEALDRGLISEGQLARFLRVDRVEARRIATELSRAPVEAGDGVPDTLALDLGAALPHRGTP